VGTNNKLEKISLLGLVKPTKIRPILPIFAKPTHKTSSPYFASFNINLTQRATVSGVGSELGIMEVGTVILLGISFFALPCLTDQKLSSIELLNSARKPIGKQLVKETK